MPLITISGLPNLKELAILSACVQVFNAEVSYLKPTLCNMSKWLKIHTGLKLYLNSLEEDLEGCTVILETDDKQADVIREKLTKGLIDNHSITVIIEKSNPKKKKNSEELKMMKLFDNFLEFKKSAQQQKSSSGASTKKPAPSSGVKTKRPELSKPPPPKAAKAVTSSGPTGPGRSGLENKGKGGKPSRAEPVRGQKMGTKEDEDLKHQLEIIKKERALLEEQKKLLEAKRMLTLLKDREEKEKNRRPAPKRAPLPPRRHRSRSPVRRNRRPPSRERNRPDLAPHPREMKYLLDDDMHPRRASPGRRTQGRPKSPIRRRSSPERFRRSPKRFQRSPERFQRSPERFQRSPERFQRSPERFQQSAERFNRSPEQLPWSNQQYHGFNDNTIRGVPAPVLDEPRSAREPLNVWLPVTPKKSRLEPVPFEPPERDSNRYSPGQVFDDYYPSWNDGATVETSQQNCRKSPDHFDPQPYVPQRYSDSGFQAHLGNQVPNRFDDQRSTAYQQRNESFGASNSNRPFLRYDPPNSYNETSSYQMEPSRKNNFYSGNQMEPPRRNTFNRGEAEPNVQAIAELLGEACDLIISSFSKNFDTFGYYETKYGAQFTRVITTVISKRLTNLNLTLQQFKSMNAQELARKYTELYSTESSLYLIKTIVDKLESQHEAASFGDGPTTSGGNGNIDSQFGGNRNAQFGGNRNSQHGSDRNNQYGSDRSNQYGSDRSNQYSSDRSNQYSSVRNNQHGNDRNNQYGSDRNNQHGNDNGNQFGGNVWNNSSARLNNPVSGGNLGGWHAIGRR